jgi:hypothetical protein
LRARRRHLPLREAQRPLQSRRHQRVPTPRGPDLPRDRFRPLFNGRLLSPRGRAAASLLQLGRHPLLALRQVRGLAHGAVERIERFAAPLGRQRIALAAQRFGELVERLLGLLSRPARPPRVALLGALGRLTHGLLGPRRQVPRRGERLRRPEILPGLRQSLRQGVRLRGDGALRGGRRRVGPPRRVPIPGPLLLPQRFGVGRERG